MGKRARLVFSLTACLIFLGATHLYSAAAPVKMSIFNFQPLNIEASTLGTTVTNMLITSLAAESGLAILDRKELETFLMLNDMQQNDKLDNIAAIGGRLGLDVIVVGTVDKKGSVLLINCKIVHIEQKKIIFSQQQRSLGDARLAAELDGLAKAVAKALLALSAKPKEEAFSKGPVNVQKRPGNRRIQLNWEKTPETGAMAYEVFRATQEKGPYAKVGQVTHPEFVDQDLENKVVYYYKIRAYDEKGMPSEYSEVVAAETALTPNAPVLLKADSHIKSIQLTWTPSPMASGDPLKLKGYKLYRAPHEQGTYKEVANVSGGAIAGEGAAATDRLPRITFTDKGLPDGEVYYYRLTAYNEKNLESEFSSSLKGSTIAAITDVAIQGDLIREIRLSWPAQEIPAVKGYAVYRSDKENQDFKRIKVLESPTATSAKKVQYTDTEGLGDLLRYYYKITAWEVPELESAPSAVVSAQTKGKPPVPEGVQAASGLVKKVEITWLASKAEDVEGYKIYGSRKKDGEFVLIKKVTGRTNNKFIDEERDNGKLEDNGTYFYRMTTYNKVEVESSSMLVGATTKPRPVKPRALQGESLKVKEIPLSWQDNPEADIAYYHLLRSSSENDDFSRVARVAGKTSYLDKDLKDGTTYRYALQAEDRAGLLSDFSEILRIQTKPRPKSPGAFSGRISGGMANLTWEGGADQDIAYYSIYEKKFFGLEKIASPAVPTFSEAAPAPGKSKTYVITVTDRDGLESEPSPEVTVTGR